ncbi:stromal membrane-associated protein 2-like protein [Dinothrombium tinctorium]|uniref:Stromal membrane-associated protein 2-like protein n=1 Tax=Dinothrombium tinctorium TaxID=1965070 RepID=A0A3S3QKZ5_9ACAR|nr:stromal membrane-associated protein 2-like protein [Dinothrombium tinctorium]
MNKAEKEKQKLIQEKCQNILNDLLRDDDNKYCVDCDAKGPRWASWNLGIFLCIRCAGIHRNLGVHISKVKSVNLDAWTAHQVAYLQQMGNSKARAVYEANLPDNFRRPQVDSALEAFIRAKYEQKKYIAKEWVQPPTPPPATNPVPRPHSSPAGTAINADKVVDGIKSSDQTKPSNDLLGLETPQNAETASSNSEEDPFDAFVSAPTKSNINENASKCDKKEGKSDEETDFFNQKAPEEKKLDKESILKLYENSNLSVNMLNLNSVNQQIPFTNSTPHTGIMGQAFAGQMQPQHTQGVPVIPQGAFFNGPTQPISQASMFTATTNPFLATSIPNSYPPNVTQLQQQMSSLQLNSALNNSWIPTQNNLPQASVANVATSQFPTTGLINPFVQTSTSVTPSGYQTNDMFVGNYFASQTTDNTNTQWAMNPNAVQMTTNLWQ